MIVSLWVNAPLISLIRRGKITSKNPYLYTPNSIEDVFDNCKMDEYGTKLGLNSDEKKNYMERNIMFKSYDEICFGEFHEHSVLQSFLSSIVILDIFFEEYDENLWRIVLGYMPLNIEFEKIRLDVNDVKKVYDILFLHHWELFMTGIFRATEVALPISYWFWEYYEEYVKTDSENINKLAFISDYLSNFYHEVLKKKIDGFINRRSYYGYKDKYIQESSTYQSLESIISIQKEMRLYQGEADSEEIKGKYDSRVWDSDIINILTRENFSAVLSKYTYTDAYLDYEDVDAIYATYILDLSEKLLHSLSRFQSFQEENSHCCIWSNVELLFCRFFLLTSQCYSNIFITSLIVSNISQIVINSNIFLEVDSYWALESYLGIPKLYQKSHQLLYTRNKKQTLTQDYENIVLIVYGLFSSINFLFLLVLIFWIGYTKLDRIIKCVS